MQNRKEKIQYTSLRGILGKKGEKTIPLALYDVTETRKLDMQTRDWLREPFYGGPSTKASKKEKMKPQLRPRSGKIHGKTANLGQEGLQKGRFPRYSNRKRGKKEGPSLKEGNSANNKRHRY